MQTLETIKIKSQENFATLLEKGNSESDTLKTLGMTVGGALVGAVAIAATAPTIIGLFSLLTVPPVALTVGAVGGGLLGWNYMQRRHEVAVVSVPPAVTPLNPAATVLTTPTAAAEPLFDEIPVVADTTGPTVSAVTVVDTAVAAAVDESLSTGTAQQL